MYFRFEGVRVTIGGEDRVPGEIDTSKAHAARVYDYMLGGTANFKADREAAEHAFAAWPGGFDGVRADVRANRALLGRMVRHLVGAGVRQFLDIGTGIPAQGCVHEVALPLAPEARVVYVDRDPVVLAHAHRLLMDVPAGATSFVCDDARETDRVIESASATLDLGRPVAVLLFGVLHCMTAADDPAGVIRRIMAPLAPGSYLALTHLASDVAPEAVAESIARIGPRMAEPVVLRSRKQVTALFDGLDLKEPGVVQLPQWHPDPSAPPPGPLPLWCGLARKTGASAGPARTGEPDPTAR